MDFMPIATKKVRYLIRDNYDYSDYPSDGYNKDGKYVDVNIRLFNRNEWLIEPSMSDWTYGEQASAPKGELKFGKVEFSYKSEKDDAYSTNVPSEPGNYFMRAYSGSVVTAWFPAILESDFDKVKGYHIEKFEYSSEEK